MLNVKQIFRKFCYNDTDKCLNPFHIFGCIPGTDSIALVTFQLSQQARAVVNSFMSKEFILEYFNNSEVKRYYLE